MYRLTNGRAAPADERHAAAPKRIAVLTLYTTKIREYGEISAANKAAYCERHQYDFIACDHSLDPSRPPAWSKIRLVQRHLSKYDWAFWSDADSLLMNFARRIEELIGDEYDLVIASDENGPCAGQFIIRNTPASHAFLEQVYRQRQFIRHPWWDQAAMHYLLHSGEAGVRCSVLPQRRLNSYPGSFQWGDFVIHLAGKIDKLAGMRCFASITKDPLLCDEPEGWRSAIRIGPGDPGRLRARLRTPQGRRRDREMQRGRFGLRVS